MAECPFCEGGLTPVVAQSRPPEVTQRLRRRLSIIGFVIAAAVLLWRLINK